MEGNEIKKAWNAFKREIKKETGIDFSGCCYMNKKQIENGTATILLCNDVPFEAEVQRLRKTIDTVNGYETWSDDEKKRSVSVCEEEIKRVLSDEERYATKENQANQIAAKVFDSNAFKAMASAIQITSSIVEFVKKWEGLGAYQIRIYY